MNAVASRGCPYRCNWCAKPISGDRFHVRPAEAVAEEMLRLKTDYGVEHIWFGDDVFALSHRWAEQLADEVEKRNCSIPFKIQSRADLMTDATVQALRRAGCAEVWMGVESGSQKILDAMDKGLRVSEVVDARRRLKDAGIQACYFLRFGYPGETWKEIHRRSPWYVSPIPTTSGCLFLIRSQTLSSTRRYKPSWATSAIGPIATTCLRCLPPNIATRSTMPFAMRCMLRLTLAQPDGK